jgi:hypothetical protein
MPHQRTAELRRGQIKYRAARPALALTQVTIALPNHASEDLQHQGLGLHQCVRYQQTITPAKQVANDWEMNDREMTAIQRHLSATGRPPRPIR